MGLLNRIQSRAGEEIRRVKVRRKIEREASLQARQEGDRVFLIERTKVLQAREVAKAKERAKVGGLAQTLTKSLFKKGKKKKGGFGLPSQTSINDMLR